MVEAALGRIKAASVRLQASLRLPQTTLLRLLYIHLCVYTQSSGAEYQQLFRAHCLSGMGDISSVDTVQTAAAYM